MAALMRAEVNRHNHKSFVYLAVSCDKAVAVHASQPERVTSSELHDFQEVENLKHRVVSSGGLTNQ